MLPGCSIFLDVDDLLHISDLETYIDQSGCILLFLSKGYLRSRNCIREVRATVEKAKPRVHVWEADTTKGGAPLEEIRDRECPADLQELVFDGTETVQWHRLADFQLVSLKLIAEQMLIASPQYVSKKTLTLTMRGELLANELVMPDNVQLHVSASNPGAADAAGELQSRYASLTILATTEGATHFFLYLSAETFLDKPGVRLAEEVRQWRQGGLPIVMAHENDPGKKGCEFGRCGRSVHTHAPSPLPPAHSPPNLNTPQLLSRDAGGSSSGSF